VKTFLLKFDLLKYNMINNKMNFEDFIIIYGYFHHVILLLTDFHTVYLHLRLSSSIFPCYFLRSVCVFCTNSNNKEALQKILTYVLVSSIGVELFSFPQAPSNIRVLLKSRSPRVESSGCQPSQNLNWWQTELSLANLVVRGD